MVEHLGTVVSTLEGPSPSIVSFVVNNGKAHKGMFVELEYSEGLMMLLVEDVIKTNRYFERPDSVKVIGEELEKNFPTSEWEFLIAQAKPIGVFKDEKIFRATYPPSPGTKVFIANSERIKKFLGLQEDGLDLGNLQFHDVSLKVNLSKLLQKHLAIVALSGAGKCLSYSNKIQLANGTFIEIGELVEKELKKSNIVVDGIEYAINENDSLKVLSLSNENKVIPSRINLLARRKSPEKLILIKTQTGKTLECTPEHLIPIFNKNANIEWIPASQIKQKNFLLSPRFPCKGKNTSINLSSYSAEKEKLLKKRIIVDKYFARFLAYVLSKGNNFGHGFSFTNPNKKIMNDFIKVCEKTLSEKSRLFKNNSQAYVHNKVLATALNKIGFTKPKWARFVPTEILQSKEEIIVAFLSALIDCKGSVSNRKIKITLTSDNLIDSIQNILLRLGIVSHKETKTKTRKKYTQITISGAKNYAILSKKLLLLNDHKKRYLQSTNPPKEDNDFLIVPNLKIVLKEISSILSPPKSTPISLTNCFPEENYSSQKSLKKWIKSFNKRALSLQTKIQSIKELFFSLPSTTEEALCIVSGHNHKADFNQADFNQITKTPAISSTMAGRIIKYSSPEKSNIKETSEKLKKFLKVAGIKTNEFCKKNGFDLKTFNLCEKNIASLNYQNFYNLVKAIYYEAIKLESKISHINQKLRHLNSIFDSGIFFDPVVSVTEIKPSSEYVYDLSIEHGNFIANNLIVHNSYFVSVLLEELLSRSKEQGQIGIVVIDTHGEYTCFGEPVKQCDSKKFVDFSSKTKIINASKIKIACPRLNIHMIDSLIGNITPTQKRAMSSIFSKLSNEMKNGSGPFDLNTIKAEIESIENEKIRSSLHAIVLELEELGLFGKIDDPSIIDFVKPGQLVVVNLNEIISEKKKQFIVSYISNRLFNERRSHSRKIPPFALFVEEAHNFIPEGTAKEHAIARSYLRTIAREGRKFGAALVFISQRPKRLDTTTLANCNTNIILRITNPYDLDHISQSSEGLDKQSIGIISSLRVGEALIVGEAVGAPTFFKVRLRKSAPSRHETTLEESAKAFQSDAEKKEEEINSFL